MKLNFLEILSNKNHTADDIAREIVSLEKKTDELKTELEKLHGLSKELRAKRICGDSVNTRDIETLREKISEFEEDIAVCNETRQSLEARLRDRIKKDNLDELADVELALEVVRSEEHKQLVEMAQTKARLDVIQENLSEDAHRLLGVDNYNEIVREEKRRFSENLSIEQTTRNKTKKLRKRQFVLKSVNLNTDFETLLTRHRQTEA